MATTMATVTTATGITATTTDTSASEVCEPPRAASRGGFSLRLQPLARRDCPSWAMRRPLAVLAFVALLPGGPAAADPFTFFLERAKVALNDGALFGAGGPGFVRLNFGTPRALLTEGLERMRRALAG